MRTTHRIVSSLGAALLGSLALTAPAQAEPVSVRSIPSYCTPGSDSNYFGAHCQTQRVYHVKAYCDHSDGRSKVLRGNDASNNGWSTIHCNTLGSGWRYRAASGIVNVN
ncbi:MULTISPECIES: hypothetical protein [Streptomyces]|uniref:hypothetical protein n=1 Tax=Streptomyces TaxID=1883 RepID=UPI000AA69547|nr:MULTISPECIES: hypothetical protein [unclassified Streptomyces]MCP3770729.1 hypothetical protein [Streptomyces sp. MAR25Y5]